MKESLQAVRGMKDTLPHETPLWQHLETVLHQCMLSYGYQEIRTPIVENTELFKRSVGEVTDIVEKEMYTFNDRNGDLLSLRPEGTAGCLRAALENGLLHHQTQKLWYKGPQFRHERPQKGRLRQFHQFGLEAIGFTHPAIDAEVLLITARIFKLLHLEKQVTLQINSLGSKEDRARYREQLVVYFNQHLSELDEDSKRRLQTNPLRILDSKNPDMQPLIANAPLLIDTLSSEAATHFTYVKQSLDALGIAYTVNPHLVRGLDYYCLTVFEWVTTALGAQGTVCAGGRYDGLIEQLGGAPTPGIGFAMGLERIIALLEETKAIDITETPDIYFILSGESALSFGLQVTERIHDGAPSVKLITDFANTSFKSQFKKADKSGARLACIIGEDEALAKTITVKYLREERPQCTLPLTALLDLLKTI